MYSRTVNDTMLLTTTKCINRSVCLLIELAVNSYSSLFSATPTMKFAADRHEKGRHCGKLSYLLL